MCVIGNSYKSGCLVFWNFDVNSSSQVHCSFHSCLCESSQLMSSVQQIAHAK